MIYRRFGRTELQMPVFSCGGMRYQFKWQDMPLDEIPAENQANLEATIRRAVELGINHIETARGYGCSERQLGCILPQLPRDEIIVQTKVGSEADADVFRQNVNESFERLQLEYFDLLAIHGINSEENLEHAIRPGGCLAVAREFQKAGKVRHVGFSTHASRDVILRAITHEGDGGFDYVNLHWYYILQHNWPAIVEARRRDMGVFIISPSDKGGMLYKPSEKLVALCAPLHPIVFNDLFCLAHPEVHTLSIGAARPGDLDIHLETLPLLARAKEILEPIVQRLAEAYATAVPPELADPHSLPLPRWEDIPGQIHIANIVWLYNLARAFDMVEYGQMRYNLMGSGGYWFPGNHAGGLEEVDLSTVLKECPGGAAVPGLLREAHAQLYTEPVKRLSETE
jgi:predicted aldo/keto reductase-like oxidoreductase